MMSRNLMKFARQEWLKSFIRVGKLALATLLLLALASPAQAQTFDQAVAAACTASDLASNFVCSGTPGPSSGSTTALSRESSPVEE